MRRPIEAALHRYMRIARRMVGLSPMQAVLRELMPRRVSLKGCRTLEVFGFTGEMHIQDYYRRVGPLEIWEWTQRNLEALRRNVPGASIRITDSYQEIERSEEKSDIVIVDNSPHLPGHVEHFDLFPAIFRILRSPATLILNVFPTISPDQLKYRELCSEVVYGARRGFYRTSTPECLSHEEMVRAYRDVAAMNGFELDYSFRKRRNSLLYCLVIGLRAMKR